MNNRCSLNKNINLKKIERIVTKLGNFYPKEEVEQWGKQIVKAINTLFRKYKVVKYEVNRNSYMGIVIDCTSQTHGAIYIKAVPPMINRFETEVNTLKLLPKKLVCKLYEIDYTKKIMVMEKIIPGDLITFYENKEIIMNVFKILFKDKIETAEVKDFFYKDFFDVVTKDYNICKSNHYNNDIVDMLYDSFCRKYELVCKNQKKYVLHGDVYKNNMLLCGNMAKLIDPLGFSAPFVFELLSICSYEMLYNDKNNLEILNDFTSFFSDFVDEKVYKDALFCQLVKVYIPSIYEANDGGVRAGKWLNIIKELYPEFFKEANK